jgi:hypothetical protein
MYQLDLKAIVGGAFSAAAETYDQVVGFFVPFGQALVAAARSGAKPFKLVAL